MSRPKIEKLGKFEIQDRIGVGGFGEVYRGYDPFIKRYVAVKTCTALDDEVRRRFFHEAEIVGNLHHRNVTTVYDFGVQDEVPYLVQEYLTGEDLDRKIKRGAAIPLAEKLGYLAQIAEGLAYAHANGVVHRDVKPANIRILEDGTVKIMDFGIAKLMQQETGLTKTGMTVGTAAYLAPEQIRGDRADQRTDVFSFGVLAYELLTYKRPFSGAQISAVLYQILHSEPTPVQETWPDCPPPLRQLLESCLHKDPAERFADCGQVLEMLEGTLDHETRPPGSPNDAGPEDPTTLMSLPVPSSRSESGTQSASGERTSPGLGDLELSVTSRVPVKPHRPTESATASRNTPSSRGLWIGLMVLLVAVAGMVLWQWDLLPPSSSGTPEANTTANTVPTSPTLDPSSSDHRDGTASPRSANSVDTTGGPPLDNEPDIPTPEDVDADGASSDLPSAAEPPSQLPPPPAPAKLTLRPGWDPSIEFQLADGPFERLDTPRTLQLEPGTHVIGFRVALPGYRRTARRTVTLTSGQTRRLAPPFPLPGTLVIRAAINYPNGQVLLDGEDLGRTPLTVERRAPGDHLLEVRPLSGNDVPALLQTVSVVAAETTIVTFRLGDADPFTVATRAEDPASR